MDDAFSPFATTLQRLTDLGGELVEPEAGVRTYITGVSIDTPVELDVTRDQNGALRIGTTPPLYALRTSVSPSFHKLSFVAKLED
jgi:hypothetical protein